MFGLSVDRAGRSVIMRQTLNETVYPDLGRPAAGSMPRLPSVRCSSRQGCEIPALEQSSGWTVTRTTHYPI
ncbi:MAG: hypothetical protein ACRD8U_05735, partial [Pyrinomonadaceae bacterium]